MSHVEDIVENILNDADLTNLILNSKCLKTLNVLLSIKRKRNLNKIALEVKNIYNNDNEDLDLLCETLESAFMVIENIDKELEDFVVYLNCVASVVDDASKNGLKIAKLLNQLIIICKSHNKIHIFLETVNKTVIECFLLSNLLDKSDPIRKLIISVTLPEYFGIQPDNCKVVFLTNIFKECKSIGNLDILCVLYNNFNLTILVNSKLSLLNNEDYWIFLENCLSGADSYMQKQAKYLISKSIEAIFKNPTSIKDLSIYVTSKKPEESKNNWNDFLILLDNSREKQLHLIEPSLKLLASVNNLHYLWQLCIYKILLNHTQNSVVYLVAIHILQEKYDNEIFRELFKHFLCAINKNEYSQLSNRMFKLLGDYCLELKNEQFVILLQEIWIPSCNPLPLWSLFNNIFTLNSKQTFPVNLFESIYNGVGKLPNVYVRNGCHDLLVFFFIRNYNSQSFLELYQVLKIIWEVNETTFKVLVMKNRDIILGSLYKDLQDNLKSENTDVKKLQLCLRMSIILGEHETNKKIIKDYIGHRKISFVLVHFFYVCDVEFIYNYVKDAILKLTDEDIDNFKIIITVLLMHNEFKEKLYLLSLNILKEDIKYSNSTIYAALLLVSCNRDKKETLEIVNVWKVKLLRNSEKIDSLICNQFVHLYLFVNQNAPKNLQETILILHNVFDTQSDKVVSNVFQYLFLIIQNTEPEQSEILKGIVEDFLKELVKLRKSIYFKSAFTSFVGSLYHKSFFANNKYISNISFVNETLLELSENSDSIRNNFANKIKNLVVSSKTTEGLHSLVTTIVELLLQGVIVKKEDRIEYFICQEIATMFQKYIFSPNILKVSTRLSALDSIVTILDRENNIFPDEFAICLINKYKLYFNKRYFPDSQIHIQKLRIIQALLVIYPNLSTVTSDDLTNLIIDSFCEEIHQPCVKHLMQWLLICLLLKNDDEKCFFAKITDIIKGANRTQPSTVVALIPVSFHLTLFKPECQWQDFVEALLPWCMGANFKLRVYSQFAIVKLCEKARKQNFLNFASKNEFLEKSLKTVIEASGQPIFDTLKTDREFFETFHPEKHYSFKTIYIDIPRLNQVTPLEWENIDKCKFTLKENCWIKNLSEDETFSNSVDNKFRVTTLPVTDQETLENVWENTNIQRKITPWKNLLGDEDCEKSLGDFIVIASLVDKPTNLGGISRTCEVFGVQQLVLNDCKIIKNKEFSSLSMSSEKWLDIAEVKLNDLKDFLTELKSKGFILVGAEQTSDSVELSDYKFSKKSVLLLGNEKEGIPPNLIPLLDACVEIPQLGMIRSLNVHVAGATFIWEYTKQHLL